MLPLRRRRRPFPAIVAAALSVAAAGVVSGCGSGGPTLSDAQVERWLGAVQQLANSVGTESRCYLVPQSALPTTVTHPAQAWVVEGFNDQTGDSRRFAGCSIHAASATADPGDGEIGIELASQTGQDHDRSTVFRRLPGTRWEVSTTSWPGTGRTTDAEATRVERAVARSVAAPPGDPSRYAGPSDAFD